MVDLKICKKGVSDNLLLWIIVAILILSAAFFIVNLAVDYISSPHADPKDIVNQGMMIPLLGSYLWSKLFNKTS